MTTPTSCVVCCAASSAGRNQRVAGPLPSSSKIVNLGDRRAAGPNIKHPGDSGGLKEDTQVSHGSVDYGMEHAMKTHKVAGGGGVQLHVVEAGNSGGRPILFIHGISQSSLTWSRQLDSELARDHRLVAMDLRGHGLSDKPRDAYGDSRLWADDVRAVIDALNLIVRAQRLVVRPAGHPGLYPALRRGPDWRHPLRRWHYEARQRRSDVRRQARVPEPCARAFFDGRRRERTESRVLVATVLCSSSCRRAICTSCWGTTSQCRLTSGRPCSLGP